MHKREDLKFMNFLKLTHLQSSNANDLLCFDKSFQNCKVEDRFFYNFTMSEGYHCRKTVEGILLILM